MENRYRNDVRSISRLNDVQEKWPLRRTLLFVVVVSLALWGLILCPIFLILQSAR
jgi:hypothetical protein